MCWHFQEPHSRCPIPCCGLTVLHPPSPFGPVYRRISSWRRCILEEEKCQQPRVRNISCSKLSTFLCKLAFFGFFYLKLKQKSTSIRVGRCDPLSFTSNKLACRLANNENTDPAFVYPVTSSR